MSGLATDVSISTFGADGRRLVDAARRAEDVGFDGVWTLDHFSGSMLGRPSARHVFTTLGAMAAVTSRVRVGPLVANMMNRHPVTLAGAVGTLQSLSADRAVLGVGTGAAAGSRFAGEHDAIGRLLHDGPARRRRLVETIEVVRMVFAGGGDYDGEFVTLRELDGVVGPEPLPPIVIGANGPKMVELACEHADGVNIRMGPGCLDLVATACRLTAGRPFEVSVLGELDADHPAGGPTEQWLAAGVDRRVLTLWGDDPVDRLDEMAALMSD